MSALFCSLLLNATYKKEPRTQIVTSEVATMGEEVKVFGIWPSPYSCRVELALKLKGIKYDFIEEDLGNKSDLLLKYNPIHKKIPVLLHNGNPVVESLIILDYIDEAWPQNPILPRDPYARNMARFWAKFLDEKFMPATRRANMMKEKEAIEEVIEMLQILENEVKGKDFFGGDKIGYLDIVATNVAFWFTATQEVVGMEMITEDKFPNLYNWIARLASNEVVKEWRPPREKHLAQITRRFQKFKSANSK